MMISVIGARLAASISAGSDPRRISLSRHNPQV